LNGTHNAREQQRQTEAEEKKKSTNVNRRRRIDRFPKPVRKENAPERRNQRTKKSSLSVLEKPAQSQLGRLAQFVPLKRMPTLAASRLGRPAQIVVAQRTTQTFAGVNWRNNRL
jgi:hypothetical protein